MWPSALAGSSHMKSTEEGFAGLFSAFDPWLDLPQEELDFLEQGSYCVNPEPAYLLGLWSVQQLPADRQNGCP